jgi:putative tRNA adenosine deaminase-associated protein
MRDDDRDGEARAAGPGALDEYAVDLAVAAYREDDAWLVEPIPASAVTTLPALIRVLRQQPASGPVLGLVSVEDDYFVAVRVQGGTVRVLLSDGSAALDDTFASGVLELVGRDPDSVLLDDREPAGDLGIFADLGVPAFDLDALCHSLTDPYDEFDDVEPYPEDVLGTIATRLGFGGPFEQAVHGRWS